MNLNIDDILLRQILKENLVRPDIPEKDEIIDLLSHILEQDTDNLRHLILLLLRIEPVLNYQIGDTVRVKLDHIHSWNKDDIKTAIINAPDSDNCISGTVYSVDKYHNVPYGITFEYSFHDEKDGTLNKKFSQSFYEKDIFSREPGVPQLNL